MIKGPAGGVTIPRAGVSRAPPSWTLANRPGPAAGGAGAAWYSIGCAWYDVYIGGLVHLPVLGA